MPTAPALRTLAALLVVIAGLGAPPAAADWLVLVDGSRMETEGAWAVEARRVVFTNVQGMLVALPLTEIDLDASHRLTAELLEGPAAGDVGGPTSSLAELAARSREERKEAGDAVVTLTDEDVTRVDQSVVASLPPRLPPVIVYTTSWCGWCKKTKQLLTALGVPFTEKDVEASPQAALEMARKVGPGAGVPVTDVGGTIIRGYDRDGIVAALRAAVAAPAGDQPG